MKEKTFSRKWIYLILALCGVAVVGIVLVLRDTPSEEKRGPEAIRAEETEKVKKEVFPETPITQKLVKKKALPQKEASEEPQEARIELEGRVTGIDPDMNMVQIDGVLFQTASYDSTGVQIGSVDLTGIRLGDRVKVTYTQKKYGGVIESIENLSRQRVEEEVLPEEVLPEKETLEEPEELVKEQEPLEEPEEIETGFPKTMQGRVTTIDYDLAVVVVDGVGFEAAFYDASGLQIPTVDLTGIGPGDYVEVTYTKQKHGKVIESIEVLR